MTGYNGPAKNIQVLGESWNLVKDATDSSVSFPFSRVKIHNYGCEKINDLTYMLVFSGFLEPTPQTLEMPQRLCFIGFCHRPLSWAETNPKQLLNMHIYKADMKPFTEEFARGFLAGGADAKDEIETKPYPDLGEKKNGRTAEDE